MFPSSQKTSELIYSCLRKLKRYFSVTNSLHFESKYKKRCRKFAFAKVFINLPAGFLLEHFFFILSFCIAKYLKHSCRAFACKQMFIFSCNTIKELSILSLIYSDSMDERNMSSRLSGLFFCNRLRKHRCGLSLLMPSQKMTYGNISEQLSVHHSHEYL